MKSKNIEQKSTRWHDNFSETVYSIKSIDLHEPQNIYNILSTYMHHHKAILNS